MGNATSSIFGDDGSPTTTTQTKTIEPTDASREVSSGKSAELTEAEKAEAAQYSALFGGTPRAAKKNTNRGNINNNSVGEKARNAGSSGGLNSPHDWSAVGAEENSVPASPPRENELRGSNRGVTAAVKPPSPPATNDQVEEDPNEQDKQLVKTVADKIVDLQKQQTQTKRSGGGAAGANGCLPNEVPQAGALVPVAASGGATESARAQAAVENALYGGPEAAALAAAAANNEMLGLGGQGGLASSAGGPGGVAGVAPKHNHQRPVPPRNFKSKV